MTLHAAPSGALPRVAVLLATYNGMPYLPEQVESILNQRGVRVRILVSDDGSTDDTLLWLQSRAATGAPIEMLPTAAPSGSSAANFRRLIRDAPVDPDELVAFADQDDRWHLDKLQRHSRLVADGGDIVSSSVLAFRFDGSTHLVKKDWPQRQWDYLTEGPGPGCSFLLSPSSFSLVRNATEAIPEAEQTDFHDSMVYAIGRGAGLRWIIDRVPSLDYRQHDGNVMGANHGRRAAVSRLRMIRGRWHRRQAVLHARIAIAVSTDIADGGVDSAALHRVLALMESTGIRARVHLAAHASQLRRRPRDRAILACLILGFIW